MTNVSEKKESLDTGFSAQATEIKSLVMLPEVERIYCKRPTLFACDLYLLQSPSLIQCRSQHFHLPYLSLSLSSFLYQIESNCLCLCKLTGGGGGVVAQTQIKELGVGGETR